VKAPPAIYVSGVAGGTNPSPGVGIARCLREAFPAARLIAVDYSPHSAGLAWADFDECIVRPSWLLRGPQRHVAYVRSVLARGGIWLSCLDLELRLLAPHLRRRALAPCPPLRALRWARKPAAEIARRLGLAAPPSLRVGRNSDAVLGAFCREHGWPVWVKGPDYGAAPIWSWYELAPALREMAALWGGRERLLLQAHSDGHDVTLAFAALGGRLLGAAQLEKLERTAEGKVWRGRVSAVPQPLERRLRALVRDARWSGGGEIECVRDRASRLWLVECNPRFPAWIYGAALAGRNLPGLLVGTLTGEKLAQPRRREQRTFTRIVLENPAPL